MDGTLTGWRAGIVIDGRLADSYLRSAMDETLADQPGGRISRSYVIELVGPAGAGKSSLAQVMRQASYQVVAWNPPNFRDVHSLPFFASNTLQTAPHLLRYVLTQPSTPDYTSQMASIVILNGWHRRFSKNNLTGGEVLLLDQGPVYLLTDLFELNPAYCRDGFIQKWQAGLYRRWAQAIDLVVWLDAPDLILADRIRRREKQHTVKHSSDREISRFLYLCREALDQTLLKLTRLNRGLKILEFDTSTVSPLGIAAQIFSCLGLTEDLD